MSYNVCVRVFDTLGKHDVYITSWNTDAHSSSSAMKAEDYFVES